MKNKMAKYFTLCLFLVIIGMPILHAQENRVQASTKPIEYKQPDGTTTTILLKGDENIHWAETTDGYTLLSNPVSKGWEYGKKDCKANLVLSGKIAHNPDARGKKELRFLKKIDKGLKFSDAQIKERVKK
ncbi:MAG TPA: hypothetical protein PLS26_13480 [Bacteroidales bacterium]|nr:hypothetical protein [Bacteroidales bacterium]